MKTAIGWKLYYGDGTIVSSLQRSWPEAPSDNIQVLSVYFAETYRIHRDGEWHKEHYRDMYFGKDLYWRRNYDDFRTSLCSSCGDALGHKCFRFARSSGRVRKFRVFRWDKSSRDL